MHSWLYLFDFSALTALHLPFVVVVRNSKVYATLVILPSCFARQGPTFWNWENFTTFPPPKRRTCLGKVKNGHFAPNRVHNKNHESCPNFGDTDIIFFLFLKTHLVGFFGCSQIYWPGHHPKWPHQTVFLSRCAVIYITLWGIHSQPNIAFTVREAAN